ncbi:holo-ACP synthase [Glutamicibacter protophormiae]|uniref:holo-ACP synthase n=1 Tax=Kocuria TaxID=57493 RepID=UPI0006D7C6E7|nr:MULTISPECIES: holo-ACP synthase [Kocuria]MDN5631336.1 holo-ACP synthase [Kocuria sp.]WNB89131.1 holo-ACP synthase [Glutamicibacter protophormiae]
MIVGTGVDIVDIARFERQVARTPRLVERLFVPHERELPPRSLAARFAVKEAAAKALKAPPGMIWQDCWITNDADGAPHLHTTGTVAEEQRRRGVRTWHVTISHDGGMAVAFVVAEGQEGHPHD